MVFNASRRRYYSVCEVDVELALFPLCIIDKTVQLLYTCKISRFGLCALAGELCKTPL